jgi:5-methylcytosine-specific restriction endonuclease McrA
MTERTAQLLLPDGVGGFMPTEKRCNVCGEVKPLDCFTPSKDGLYGHLARCKPCNVAAVMRYYWANLEKVKKRKRERYDPVRARERRKATRERDRVRLQGWRQANPELNRAYLRRSREEHPERFREYRRKYYYEGGEKAKAAARCKLRRLRHPEEHRLESAARRTIKRRSGGNVTQRDAVRLLNRFHGRCAYCLNPADTLDHVIPLVRGGRHTIGNLLPACRSCNSSKHKWLLIEWRVRRAQFS